MRDICNAINPFIKDRNGVVDDDGEINEVSL